MKIKQLDSWQMQALWEEIVFKVLLHVSENERASVLAIIQNPNKKVTAQDIKAMKKAFVSVRNSMRKRINNLRKAEAMILKAFGIKK